MRLSKSVKIWSIAIAVTLVIGIFMAGSWFKVTNPLDPKFNPEKFRFEDYSGRSAFINAIHLSFPPGTERSYIEQVLVNNAGAKYVGWRPNPHNIPYRNNVHQYIYQMPLLRRGITDGRYLITLYFDENDKRIVGVTDDGRNDFLVISGPTGL